MRIRVVGWCAVIMSLGACSSGGGSGNVANNTAAAAPNPNSDAQNKVRSLGDGERNGVMIRAIRDAGQDCQQVESSELIQTSNNLPVYMATCSGGAVYAVAIRDDGTAQVRAAMPAEAK